MTTLNPMVLMPTTPEGAERAIPASAEPAGVAAASAVGSPVDDETAQAPTLTAIAAPTPELTYGLRLVTGLAALGALVWMRDLLAPIALAALFALMLWPAVDWARRHHVPSVISAALVVAAMMAIFWAVAMLMRQPVSDFAERWPQTRADIERRVGAFRESVEPTPAPAASAAVASRLKLRAPALAASAPPPATPRISWWEPVQKLGELAVARAQLAFAAMLTLFLALFAFLAFGHRLVRAASRGLAHTKRGKALIGVFEASQSALQAYWFTVGAINVGVAVVISGVFMAIDMPNAPLWGVLAGIMNFIPVVGPLIFVALMAIVSYTTFDTVGAVLLPVALYMVVHLIEGQVVTPALLGRRLSLNPALVLLSILFWTWAWGVLGTLLAVPLLLCLKMVCDHDPALARYGAMLE